MKTFRLLLPALVLAGFSVPALAAVRPCDPPIRVTPNGLTAATTGIAHSQTMTASGGTTYTFSVTQGVLPAGLALTNPTATTVDVTGIPTAAGTFAFTLTARNTPNGCSGGRAFALLVNDRTVVTTTAGTTAFVEDLGAVVVDSGVTVADSDSPNLATATVTITNPQDGAAEVLAATACAGLTVTPGLNSLSITGSQPPAAYQGCLRSVTYNNGSQNPGTTARVVSFVANDGIAGSATANKTVSVARTDDPPVANPVTPPAFNEDSPATITLSYADPEGDLATACAVTGLTNVTVSTPCGCTAGVCTVGVTGTSNYNGPASFNYTVTANALTSSSAAASLTITPVPDPPVANPITPPAFDEDIAAVITLSYTDPDGDQATACAVTGPTNVTVSTACACSAGVCTVGVTGTPLHHNGAASFSFTVTANAQISNSALATLSITAVNDPPVLGGVSGGFTYTENDAATAIAPALTVTDVDSTTMSSATIAVTGNFQTGQDVLSFVNGAGMGNVAVASNVGGVLTLTSAGSTATTAQWQTALRAVGYRNSSDDPNTSLRTVTFQINDGAAANNLSNQPTRTITITAVNDQPTATGFTNQPAQAGIPIAYPAGKLGGTDLEAGTTITIDLVPINVTNATVSLAANGSFTLTPLSAATAASFQYRVSDNGNPAPGVNSAYVTVSFTVAGPAIYFVKSAAVGLANCTLGNECTLATALATIGATANARIFISDANSHGNAVTLNSGGWLIGQGVTGTTFDALFGILAPAQGTLAARPSLAQPRPTVTNTVTLNTNGAVRGLNISSAAATGIADPVAAIAGALVSEVAVTTTTGTGVSFSNTAGTFSFTGVTTAGGAGVSLTGANSGGTFAFSGVVVSSGANAAFAATGGGTVTVTGAANTLASTTGTALNVANTTIGASGLTFRSISANGAANGIVLNGTGSGGLTVTGNSSGLCGGQITPSGIPGTPPTVTIGDPADCTGGTIQGTTGDGISLTSASNVSLTRMRLLNIAGVGVQGIYATNLGGSNFFRNGHMNNVGSTGSGSGNGITIENTTANMTLFSVEDSYFANALCPTSYILNNPLPPGPVTTRLDVIDSIFEGLEPVAVQSNASNNGSTTTNITGSVFRNASADGQGGTVVATAAGSSSSNTFNVSGNTYHGLNNGLASGANAGTLQFQTTGGPLNGTVSNNIIGITGAGNDNGDRRGIEVVAEPDVSVNGNTGSIDIVIDGNYINRYVDREGIFVDIREDTLNSELIIRNNNIGNLAGFEGQVGGIREAVDVQARGETPKTLNLLMTGNNIRSNASIMVVNLEVNNDATAIAANISLQSTVTSNAIRSDAGGFAVTARTRTGDTGGNLCLDMTGNTLSNASGAAGTGTVQVGEDGGPVNVEQASQAALAAANGIPSGNVTITGTPQFNTVCSAPPF